MLATQALKSSAMVKSRELPELHGAWIAEDEKPMWCTWDTNDVAALQAAFDEMNRRSGLTSKLTLVKTFSSTAQEIMRV